MNEKLKYAIRNQSRKTKTEKKRRRSLDIEEQIATKQQ